MSDLAHFRNVEMIIPGKGGVGKTGVASLTALLLSQKYRCALLDIDMITPNLAQVMGLTNAEPIFSRRRKLKAYAFNKNLTVFSLENYFKDNAGIRLGVEECERLISECLEDIEWSPDIASNKPIDFLICDMPPATSDPIKALRRIFPKNLYGIGVTSPTKLSLDNLERMLLNCYDMKIGVLGVVANMVGAEMHGATPRCGCGCGQPFYPNKDRGDGSEVVEFTKRMKCDFMGVIKYDPDIGNQLNTGHPKLMNNGAIKATVDKISRQTGFMGKFRGG